MSAGESLPSSLHRCTPLYRRDAREAGGFLSSTPPIFALVTFCTLLIFCALLFPTVALAQDADGDAYAALRSIVTVKSKAIKSGACSIIAEVDFEKLPENISKFRDAWLNKDYSTAFYLQRRKQVLLFFLLKRYGELVTEGLYNSRANVAPDRCDFRIDVSAPDVFGKIHTFEGISWSFDRDQNSRIDWNHIDPRDFDKIAIDYKIAKEAFKWANADEPALGGAPSTSSSAGTNCDLYFVRANAMFVRATPFCGRDFMDTPAGLLALKYSRRCTSLGEQGLAARFEDAMKEFDLFAKRHGKKAACRATEDLGRAVIRRAAD